MPIARSAPAGCETVPGLLLLARKMSRLLLFLLMLFGTPFQSQETARDIIDRVDRILRGESSHGVACFDVHAVDRGE